MDLFAFVGILSCVLFTGAAVYINLVEHPARLECGTELAATVFGPSYRRAASMQASLVIVATIGGIAVTVNGGSLLWLVGAAMIFAVVPFTFIGIMATNKRLLDPTRDRSSVETHDLLRKWGRLHAVRSVLGLAASCVYLYLGIAS